MSENPNKEQMHTALFMNLVFTFQTAAVQQLGLVKNPATDKVETNIEQAQMSIDMLDMIEKKTSGNLTSDESSFLSRVLDELKMNYVKQVNKGESKS
jgi:hypothetical protein